MLTEAFISHSTSEKLRVKVPGKKGCILFHCACEPTFRIAGCEACGGEPDCRERAPFD